MYSGGLGSWATAKLIIAEHGKENTILLFTDVKGDNPSNHVGEDEDTYRFIKESAAKFDCQLVWLKDHRDIWKVFKDKRFLGNSRLAHCSFELKQKPARKWLEDNLEPQDCVIYVGIDWTESHRLPAIQKNYQPYEAVAPLCEAPYYEKNQIREWLKNDGIELPRLYKLGFEHNNCGGGCVKAGQAQFTKLLQIMPDRFGVWEQKEQELQQYLGKDVSILKETVQGERKNLTLKELRERFEKQPQLIDLDDWAGCGCFVDYDADHNRGDTPREYA